MIKADKGQRECLATTWMNEADLTWDPDGDVTNRGQGIGIMGNWQEVDAFV